MNYTWTKHPPVIASYVVSKAGAWGEVQVGISEALLLVPKAQIDGEVRTHVVVILYEQRPDLVGDRVIGIAIALLAAIVGKLVGLAIVLLLMKMRERQALQAAPANLA